MSRNKHIGVFIQGGLGDALLFTPLLRHLQRQGMEVHLFSRGFDQVIQAFIENGLAQGATIAKSGKDLITRAMFSASAMDVALINPFAAGKANFTLAMSLADSIYSNGAVPFLAQRKTLVRPPILGVHDAIQNKLLWDPRLPLTLHMEEMQLDFDFAAPLTVKLPSNYVALQLSAGNNSIRYKNWPVRHWNKLLDHPAFGDVNIVLLGDEHEVTLAKQVQQGRSNVTSLVGKTSISQVHQVLKNARCLLGLDGGLMHLAVAAETPTFTLWGPSDPALYGYSQFSDRHVVVQHQMEQQRISWQNRNTTSIDSKTNSPEWWMAHLEVEEVVKEFTEFLTTLS